MIIPTSPLLRSEDYDSSVQSWIGRLLSPLNTFITNVTAAVNGNLTFQDNLRGMQKTLTFSFTANTLPYTFSYTAFGTPQSVQIVGATENGTPVIVLAAWKATSQGVTLTDLVKLSGGAVSALKTGATYNLTVRAAA